MEVEVQDHLSSVVWGALSLVMCLGEYIYICVYVVPHVLQRTKVSMAY